jgi:peroxiredoxin
LRANAFRAAIAALAVAAVALSDGAMAVPTQEDVKELQELNTASFDPAEAKRVINRVRVKLATQDLDPAYQMLMRQIALRAQVRSEAPIAEIAAAADTLRPLLGEEPRTNIQFNAQMAMAMLEREDGADQAHAYATAALAAVPKDAQWAPARAECLTLLGRAESKRGRHAQAIAHLLEALPSAPDSQAVRFALARAYEGSGKPDAAIDNYVRAIGTFPCADTTGRATLEALYATNHKSTDGLDQRIDAACKASRQAVALDSRRHEMVAPDWTIPGLDGKPRRFADLKGKVTVIDFWGSWCGPCRAELPHFQAIYEKFKGRGVEFLGISWEQVKTRAEAEAASKKFMTQNNLDFPAVVDHERKAVDAYGVNSFPTVFLIDRSGKVRYRNIGFSEDISHVLAAQIESLLE